MAGSENIGRSGAVDKRAREAGKSVTMLAKSKGLKKSSLKLFSGLNFYLFSQEFMWISMKAICENLLFLNLFSVIFVTIYNRSVQTKYLTHTT